MLKKSEQQWTKHKDATFSKCSSRHLDPALVTGVDLQVVSVRRMQSQQTKAFHSMTAIKKQNQNKVLRK